MTTSTKLAMVMAAALGTAAGQATQQEKPSTVFRVKVDMVIVSFQITDSKGHYITGLKPSARRNCSCQS